MLRQPGTRRTRIARRLGVVVAGCSLAVPLAAAPAPATAFPATAFSASPVGAASMAVSKLPAVPGDPLTGSGQVSRTLLTTTALTDGVATGTIADSEFALPPEAARPRHQFSGRLELLGEATGGGFTELRDDYEITEATDLSRHLPEISLELTQHGSHLIPAIQGLRYTGSEMWNLIVGPGRAWSEVTDGGWSRAALPFALVLRNTNCVHNGTMTFLFDDDAVSPVRYQITQETCQYFKFDLWGQLGATATRYPVRGADAIRRAHVAEVGGRLPTKPIDALAADYPDVGLDLTAFGRDLTAEHRSGYGFFYRGVNYVSECTTRHGSYPFCEAMRLPSFSVAKSIFAATALMRLARVYGPAVGQRLVRSLVPEYATAAGDWSEVTIEDALDMATGNYESSGYLVDEGDPRFGQAESYVDRIAIAFDFPHRAASGTQWVYHTTDTFIAARALQNLIGADLFDYVRDTVYRPIGLSQGAMSTARTDNSPAGMAFGGYGLFVTRDDIAKLARLYNNDAGAVASRQLLDPGLLAAAMQRDPDDRGYQTTDPLGSWYNNGFWARQFTPEQVPGHRCSFWVPFLSGYGGIDVVMVPNGATYYYFSDNDEFSWVAAVREAGKLAPYC